MNRIHASVHLGDKPSCSVLLPHGSLHLPLSGVRDIAEQLAHPTYSSAAIVLRHSQYDWDTSHLFVRREEGDMVSLHIFPLTMTLTLSQARQASRALLAALSQAEHATEARAVAA